LGGGGGWGTPWEKGNFVSWPERKGPKLKGGKRALRGNSQFGKKKGDTGRIKKDHGVKSTKRVFCTKERRRANEKKGETALKNQKNDDSPGCRISLCRVSGGTQPSRKGKP